MKKICQLKSLSQQLQFNKKMINDIANTVDGIDKTKLSKITGALDYACRSLHTMIKTYIYPKIDGPKYQETCYDDDMPGISFLISEGHAYYSEVAAERILKKFHAQWRAITIEDITPDNPASDLLMGTWALREDGKLGVLCPSGRLCDAGTKFGVSVESAGKDAVNRLILVRKR